MSFYDTVQPLNGVPEPWTNMYFNSITLSGVTGHTGSVPLGVYIQDSFTSGITGAMTGQTATFTITQIGNVVNIDIPSITQASATASTFITTLSMIPAQYRPPTGKYFLYQASINNTYLAATMIVTSGGALTFFGGANQGFFTASQQAAIVATSVTYNLAQ